MVIVADQHTRYIPVTGAETRVVAPMAAVCAVRSDSTISEGIPLLTVVFPAYFITVLKDRFPVVSFAVPFPKATEPAPNLDMPVSNPAAYGFTLEDHPGTTALPITKAKVVALPAMRSTEAPVKIAAMEFPDGKANPEVVAVPPVIDGEVAEPIGTPMDACPVVPE